MMLVRWSKSGSFYVILFFSGLFLWFLQGWLERLARTESFPCDQYDVMKELPLPPPIWTNVQQGKTKCAKNAIVLVGHLRTYASTFPYINEYILRDGDFDVFWFGPDIVYASLRADPYWATKHSDKGNDQLTDQNTDRVTLESIKKITGTNFTSYGTYKQDMRIFERYTSQQCLPRTFRPFYIDRSALYVVPRSLAQLYNIQEAQRYLNKLPCQYDRILWTRPDIKPEFYFREPLTRDDQVCNLNVDWTTMFGRNGQVKPDAGTFCDLVIWTSGKTARAAFTDLVTTAVQAWHEDNVGPGHTESTLRYVLESFAKNEIVRCPMFPFSIARNDFPLHHWGWGWTPAASRKAG